MPPYAIYIRDGIGQTISRFGGDLREIYGVCGLNTQNCYDGTPFSYWHIATINLMHFILLPKLKIIESLLYFLCDHPPFLLEVFMLVIIMLWCILTGILPPHNLPLLSLTSI